MDRPGDREFWDNYFRARVAVISDLGMPKTPNSGDPSERLLRVELLTTSYPDGGSHTRIEAGAHVITAVRLLESPVITSIARGS